MRLVLYTLETDRRRANGIAATNSDVFHEFRNDPGAGTVIKMTFVPKPNAQGLYILDEDTRIAFASAVGLLSACDEVVVMMHAGAAKLSVQGASHGNVEIAGGRWSLHDARTMISACAPTRLFMLCCQFGKVLEPVIGQDIITDGPAFLAQRMPAGATVFAMNENVMAIGGMPVLRPNFYTRQVAAG
jgi:hypothetical protein